jgi:hypothetical protein
LFVALSGLMIVFGLTGCSDASSVQQPSDQARISSGRVLYASAMAEAGGDGSRQAPFNSLQALEQASLVGDDLVILASPLEVPALNGGIALKPHQRLMGDGPDVLQKQSGASVKGASALSALPRIRNTNLLRLSGDAIRLSEANEVSNLVITESMRGAIYGLNSPNTVIKGNDISGFNITCTIGYTVQPFVLPTVLPFIGAPILLPAGWAGIMVDANSGAGKINVTDNFVHNSACGNGIDIRISGNADYMAEVSGNNITELEFGPLHQAGFHLVHAISLQIRNNGQLTANSENNSQSLIGAEGADCEGLFMNLSESGNATWTIDNNLFEYGIGGFSCNGLEVVISNGNAKASTFVSNSFFRDNPGDMIQLLNFGTGSTAILEVDNVVVKDTTTRGGDPDINGFPSNRGIPGNLGDCLLAGSTGSGNTTRVKVSDSDFSGCNNGFSLLSGINPLSNVLGSITGGSLLSNILVNSENLFSSLVGPDGVLQAEISNTAIYNNDINNFVVSVLAPLQTLNIKVEDSSFSQAGANSILLRKNPTASVDVSNIDFGNGALGSAGGNCILGGAPFDVRTEGFPAVMRGNWWGQAGGPKAENIFMSEQGLLDLSMPINSVPIICSSN